MIGIYCSKTVEPPEPGVAYDRPDETLDIVDNVVEWDLWDSVDIKQNKLYKYSELVEHPMGHVYLDSIYYPHGPALADRRILMIRARDYIYFENTLELNADPRNQIYREEKDRQTLMVYWIGKPDPFPFSEHRVCVSIKHEYYYKLLFLESPYIFQIIPYN
jgi:hypothetical protein